MAQASRLAEIVEACRREVEAAKVAVPLEILRDRAERRTERRDFVGAISEPGLSVIAEMKKSSPSRGIIRPDYRPQEIARAYESAGAAALSVLTAPRYFGGSMDHLALAANASRLPVLRKDFIVDEYQVYESAAAAADALLLIVAALDDRKLKSLLDLSGRLKLSTLVEVHTENELDRALATEALVIGVNNRNLATLNVDIETSFRLRERIPPGRLAVSESGIKTHEHLQRLGRAGFDAVLIGEHLLQAEDPGRELARLLDAVRSVKVH